MKTKLATRITALVMLALIFAVPSISASATGFGLLYYNGTIVRTVVPPSSTDVALDTFYKITNGASGQLGIASVAPGHPGYHGGHWAVSLVTFNSNITPYLLKSQADVLAAQQRGDVSVTRNPSLDFLCPIQP